MFKKIVGICLVALFIIGTVSTLSARKWLYPPSGCSFELRNSDGEVVDRISGHYSNLVITEDENGDCIGGSVTCIGSVGLCIRNHGRALEIGNKFTGTVDPDMSQENIDFDVEELETIEP